MPFVGMRFKRAAEQINHEDTKTRRNTKKIWILRRCSIIQGFLSSARRSKTEMSGDIDASHPTRIPGELANVVKVGVRANREVPGSIALGGAICALFAHHRASRDIDFVLTDLNR